MASKITLPESEINVDIRGGRLEGGPDMETYQGFHHMRAKMFPVWSGTGKKDPAIQKFFEKILANEKFAAGFFPV